MILSQFVATFSYFHPLMKQMISGWQLSSDTLHIFVYFNFLFIYSNTLIDNVITRWLDYLCPFVWQTFNPALPEFRFLMVEEVIHCVFDILRIFERRSSIVEIMGTRYPLFIISVRKLPKASTFYHTWEIYRIFWNRKHFFLYKVCQNLVANLIQNRTIIIINIILNE